MQFVPSLSQIVTSVAGGLTSNVLIQIYFTPEVEQFVYVDTKFKDELTDIMNSNDAIATRIA